LLFSKELLIEHRKLVEQASLRIACQSNLPENGCAATPEGGSAGNVANMADENVALPEQDPSMLEFASQESEVLAMWQAHIDQSEMSSCRRCSQKHSESMCASASSKIATMHSTSIVNDASFLPQRKSCTSLVLKC